jgi:hypothetical protein
VAKSPEQLLEAETIIRWDMTGENAVLWTADPKVRKDWESFGFPVKVSALTGKAWFCHVPVDRITFKPMKGAK